MYPFTNKGLKQYLKEAIKTDSLVIPKSIKLQKRWVESSKAGNELFSEFHFETEDGNKYKLIARGKRNKDGDSEWTHIESINKF